MRKVAGMRSASKPASRNELRSKETKGKTCGKGKETGAAHACVCVVPCLVGEEGRRDKELGRNAAAAAAVLFSSRAKVSLLAQESNFLLAAGKTKWRKGEATPSPTPSRLSLSSACLCVYDHGVCMPAFPRPLFTAKDVQDVHLRVSSR